MKLKSFSAKTDQGPYLQVNEDNFEVDLTNELFMIFDGFGGAGLGDRCVSRLKDNIKTFYTRVTGERDATLPFYFSFKYLLEGNALLNSMYYAHKVLYQENCKLEMFKRAGSSSIIGALSENIITFASVGNCVCFLYRKGILQKIFQEDSINLLTVDNFKNYLKTSPLSAFGLFEDLHIQVKEVKILPGDVFITLTDGAYARLEHKEIKYIVEKVDYSYESKIKEFFELANSRGNLDNQSAIILQF